MLEKDDGDDDRNEGELADVDADPEGDKADDHIERCLNAPVATEHAGNFIELLRDRVSAHDTDQPKAGDDGKHHCSAGDEAVDPQRLESDKSGYKERE